MHSRTVKLSVLIICLTGLTAFYNLINSGIEKNGNAIHTQDDFITIVAETPYDAIYQYYKALEGNNWDLIKSLTTPELWNYIQTSDFRTNWEKKTSEDPTLKFVLFIVKKQSIDQDEGKGWILGKVDWTSERRHVPDDNRTVFVEKRGESWVIDRVVTLPSVEVVDDFYEAINVGDLIAARRLTTEKYWKQLVSAGIIHGIRRERSTSFGGVYVVFLVTDFSEKADESWVQGDVTFQPLTRKQKEIAVNVHVVKQDGDWKIDKIVGHWDIEK